MYDLKQAAILAYKQLVKHLQPFGYAPVPHSLSLWTHETKPTEFCLCVYDFGVKYYSKEDVLHLIPHPSIGKEKLLWIHVKLELYKRICGYLYANLHSKNAFEMQPFISKKTSTSTVSMVHSGIWPEAPIRENSTRSPYIAKNIELLQYSKKQVQCYTIPEP